MKCKRCNAEMRREKVNIHSYRYKCPKCGLIIGKKTEPETEYKEAFEILTGKE